MKLRAPSEPPLDLRTPVWLWNRSSTPLWTHRRRTSWLAVLMLLAIIAGCAALLLN